MPSALSVDLRERVVAAIEAGASRRQAAKRFGIGAASVIRWYESFRQEGQIAPKAMGGDRNSQRLEAQAALILRINEEHPLSLLRKLRDKLRDRGVQASTSSLSRLFARHRITRKRGCPCGRAGAAGCEGCTRGLVRATTGLRCRSPGLPR